MKLDIPPTVNMIPTCVLVLCAYTWQRFIRHLHCPSARWSFKSSCLRDNNKRQAARGKSWKHIVTSWTRSCTVRVTESGSQSRDYSMPSLETAKILLLHCRLEVYQMKVEMNFWLIVSTNGESTHLCHEWNYFCFFGTGSGVVEWDWRRNFSIKDMVFRFRNHDWPFWQSNMYATAKQLNCRFMVFKSNLRNVAVRSALQPFEAAFIILFPCKVINTVLSQTIPSTTKDINKSTFNWFFVSSEIYIFWSHFKKHEFVCSSEGILRTWQEDVHWGHC